MLIYAYMCHIAYVTIYSNIPLVIALLMDWAHLGDCSCKVSEALELCIYSYICLYNSDFGSFQPVLEAASSSWASEPSEG